MLIFVTQTNALRCYMDSSDPAHPGTEECLQVDGQGGGKCLYKILLSVERYHNDF